MPIHHFDICWLLIMHDVCTMIMSYLVRTYKHVV
jgi:hypothetical protein